VHVRGGNARVQDDHWFQVAMQLGHKTYRVEACLNDAKGGEVLLEPYRRGWTAGRAQLLKSTDIIIIKQFPTIRRELYILCLIVFIYLIHVILCS